MEDKAMRFVDVKNDVAFRKIFGNEKKTEIIISFLNAVLGLPKGKLIKKVRVVDPYQLPEIKELKSSILDLRVIDERGVSYIVEMQVEEFDGFDKRVQYYTAREYSAQIKRGEEYPKLNQVIFIGILDFEFFEDDDHYITRHRTVNIKTQKTTLDGMEYNFIELEKFNKKLEEIETLVDKWIYFIKNAENLDVIPDNVKDKGLKQAYEDAEKHSWTKKELHDYDYASMRKQDRRGAKQLAVRRATKKGYEQGMEKGIEKGMEKGIEKGIEEGMEKGKQKREIEIAMEMIKDGEAIEKIIRYTKLEKATVEKLVNEFNDKG